jgi:RimJ/RimL family protein N-acetyltransferase
LKAVLSHAFTVNRHEKLMSGCRLQNHASRRVLEKLGFEHIGRYDIDSLVLRAKLPGHRFHLTRQRWERLDA